jgi:hypothetical protein
VKTVESFQGELMRETLALISSHVNCCDRIYAWSVIGKAIDDVRKQARN